MFRSQALFAAAPPTIEVWVRALRESERHHATLNAFLVPSPDQSLPVPAIR